MDAIGEIVFHFICFGTAKILLPIFSFGQLRVLPRTAKTEKGRWGNKAFQRLPQGGVGVDWDVAAFMGLLFWAAIGAGLVVYIHYG